MIHKYRATPVKFIQGGIEDKFYDSRQNPEGKNKPNNVVNVPFKTIKLRLLNGWNSSLDYFRHSIRLKWLTCLCKTPVIRQNIISNWSCSRGSDRSQKYIAKILETISNPLSEIKYLEPSWVVKLDPKVGALYEKVQTKGRLLIYYNLI